MADFKTLVDLAGSQERWTAYSNAVKNVLPKSQRKDSQRYWSIYAQKAQEFLYDENVTKKESILPCMFNAPKLGLNPDKVFGHLWFVPYKGVLQYQIGYRGMIRMAYNSGKVSNVRADLVYVGDEWDYYSNEKGQHYIHRSQIFPNEAAYKTRKEIRGYSIITNIKGEPFIHVMDSFHIDDIKKLVKSRMGDNFNKCPWANPMFEPEMRKKSVTRRHLKYEPMSSEIANAIETEEKNERGEILSKEDNDKIMENILQDYGNPVSAEEQANLNQELDKEIINQEKKVGA
jgi:recombination protein RecT